MNKNRTVRAFLNSGVTVGIRSIVALGAFIIIIRMAEDDVIAVYGITAFIWSIIYATAQNFGAQPLLDMPRLSQKDVVSSQLLCASLALVMGLMIWMCSGIISRIYPELLGLDSALKSLVWLGPVSVLGTVEFVICQRHMRFGFIAKYQTIAVVISGIISIIIAQWEPVIGLIGIQAFIWPIFGIMAVWGKKVTIHAPNLDRMKRLMRVGRHLALEGNIALMAIQGPIILFGLFLAPSEWSLLVLVSRFVQLIASQLGRVTNIVLLPMIKREVGRRDRLHWTFMTVSYFSNGLVGTPLIGMFVTPVFMLTLLGGPNTEIAITVWMLLVSKQILDTAANTVFATFRAIGRIDVGWKWSLMTSAIWLVIAIFGWALKLEVVPLAVLMNITGIVNFCAVYWLCHTIDLRISVYLRFISPVYSFVFLSLASGVLMRFILSSWGVPLIGAELISGTSISIFYLAVILGIFKIYRRHEQRVRLQTH